MYHWITIDPDQHRFLRTVADALGVATLRVFAEPSVQATDFCRTQCAGLVTATGVVDGRQVAVVWSDFRVGAASYGQANSRRFVAFLQELDRTGTSVPLLYFVNSAGLSLMEGRRVFADAFALWPALLDYSSRNPYFTCALGKCLGLAPLLFGLGVYRVAVAGQTQLNLAGPEVISLFFGEKIDFAASAAAERFESRNDLIHEIVPSVTEACRRFRGLLSARRAPVREVVRGAATATATLLARFLDAPAQEVVPGWCERVRLFLGTRRGRPLGLFVNPPDRSNNMVTTRTLDKYAAGLDLFRALGVPVVSFLDSPGIDPRFEQSDANNFRRMLAVGERIIRYPHGAMGVVTRRCYGGSATLSFPKVFGGRRMVALRGSSFGAMHESIITRILGGSPRLLAQWSEVAAHQGPGLEDLLENGSVDAIVDPADLGFEIDRFLFQPADVRPVMPTLDLRRAG